MSLGTGLCGGRRLRHRRYRGRWRGALAATIASSC
jgi:hypothetical protein